MDPRFPRVLALFDDATQLTLGPCKTVTISGTQHSLDSKRLIYNVLNFSPSPSSLIRNILERAPDVDIYSNPELSPEQWASAIVSSVSQEHLKQFGMFLIGLHKTENLDEQTEVACLLTEAVRGRSQSALKRLVAKRDGAICPVSKCRIQVTAVEMDDVFFSECAHILPFSIQTKSAVKTAIEMFAPGFFDPAEIAQKINHPSNAINLELHTHKTFDNLLWGIEALPGDNAKPRYYYRVIKQGWTHPLIKRNDGDEIVFGHGGLAPPEYLPDPAYCNIKLAVGRVLRACGMAEVINYLFHIHEDSLDEGARAYLDGSSTMLDLLDIKLHQIAV